MVMSVDDLREVVHVFTHAQWTVGGVGITMEAARGLTSVVALTHGGVDGASASETVVVTLRMLLQ